MDALRVLAAAGFEATVPRSDVCCGLTYITTGQLDAARSVLRRSLDGPGARRRGAGPGARALVRRDAPS